MSWRSNSIVRGRHSRLSPLREGRACRSWWTWSCELIYRPSDASYSRFYRHFCWFWALLHQDYWLVAESRTPTNWLRPLPLLLCQLSLYLSLITPGCVHYLLRFHLDYHWRASHSCRKCCLSRQPIKSYSCYLWLLVDAFQKSFDLCLLQKRLDRHYFKIFYLGKYLLKLLQIELQMGTSAKIHRWPYCSVRSHPQSLFCWSEAALHPSVSADACGRWSLLQMATGLLPQLVVWIYQFAREDREADLIEASHPCPEYYLGSRIFLCVGHFCFLWPNWQVLSLRAGSSLRSSLELPLWYGFIFKQFCFLQPILACWATHCHGLQLLQLKMLAWVSCPCWCRNCLLWSSEVPSNRLSTSNLLQRCLFRVLPQLLPW